MSDYGWVRASTGSQDVRSQEIDILGAFPGALIIRPDTKAASASKGEQLDALDAMIAKLRKGDRVIVTDSSRFDRRDNLTSQVETMLDIRKTGAVIVSLAPGEEMFANGDDLGSWITTLVKQNANAEKSRTVKTQTFRGIRRIRDNKAHHGALPKFWTTKGARWAKQAYCENPAAVTDIYERVASGESLQSIGRAYEIYPFTVKRIICFEANHTGVIEYSYTYEGQIETWTHEVTPVVDSPLWWRANKVLEANKTSARNNRGGRPLKQPVFWIAGVLDCPGCGGKLYYNGGVNRKGDPRNAKLRCYGNAKQHLACGLFKGCDPKPILDGIAEMFAGDTTRIFAFQRIAGNAHELEALKADLPKLQSRLSVITDRATRRETLAQIEELEDRIDSFEVIPDDFDYAPTGQTVSQMWNDGDDTVKRGMARAVKESWGMKLVNHEGEWAIDIGAKDPAGTGNKNGIVDLGNGLCFWRETA
jgi:DNA invertase Pin-like site-specific DNA recombinase